MGNYNFDTLYKLALTTSSVATNNDYMSFKEGVVVNGALGAGIELLQLGGGKVAGVFSKNKPSKIAQLRKKVEVRQLKDSNIFKTYRNASNYNTITKLEGKLPTVSTNSRIDYYSDAKWALNDAKKLRGAAQANKIKEAEKLIAQAKLNAYKAKNIGKFKTLTGIKAGNTALKTLAANSSKFRAATKFVKGNALFSLMSVACDYNKFSQTKAVCGTKARNKEVAKSVGVAVAESVGFLAGMKAGAAVGTAVGSVLPGVGNIVGAVTGAILGGLISWGTGKLVHNAMGKSEIEKHNEEQARLWALKSKYNMDTRTALLRNAAAKISNDEKISQSFEKELAAEGVSPIDQEQFQKSKELFVTAAQENPEIIASIIQDVDSQQEEDGSSVTDVSNQNSHIESSNKDLAMQKTMQKFMDRIR